MSTTIERATLGLAFFALGGVGLWTQCAVPSDAPFEDARRSARRGGRGSTHARSFTPGDGGLEALGDGSAPELVERPIVEIRCWQVRVVDERARPVAALVLAIDADPRETLTPFRAEARIDAGGALELCTPSDTTIDLDAWTDDGRWGRRRLWISPPGDDPEDPTEPITLATFAPASVVGRVVDATGLPLAGVPVRVGGYYGEDEGGRPLHRHDGSLVVTGRDDWRSGPDGRFELPIGVLEMIVVWAEDGDHQPAVVGPVAPRLGAPVEVELRMLEGGRLFGTAVHHGVPIPDAVVRIETLDQVQTQHSPDGTFDFRALDPATPIRVEVSAEGHVWRVFTGLGVGEHQLELARGAELEVQLGLPAALEGCAAPRRPGEAAIPVPSSSLELRLHLASDDILHEYPRAPDALTTFRELPAGRARLVGDAFGAFGAMDVELREGETTRVTLPIEVALEHGILRAHFVGPGDLDLGLTVDVIGGDGDFYRSRYMRAADHTCVVLPAGTSTVAVHRDDGLTARAEVTMPPGGVVTQTFHLERAPARVIQLDDMELTDAPPRTCSPRLAIAHRGQDLLVVSVEPGLHGLLPGDRVVAVEGAVDDRPWSFEHALWGEEGTSAILEIVRPDGSRARLSLPRTICE